MLRPSNWDRLTSEEKHKLMELVTNEMVLKDLKKAYRRVRRSEAT
jgi:predicted Fe-S protein YdhL (DUF1289 family)